MNLFNPRRKAGAPTHFLKTERGTGNRLQATGQVRSASHAWMRKIGPWVEPLKVKLNPGLRTNNNGFGSSTSVIRGPGFLRE